MSRSSTIKGLALVAAVSLGAAACSSSSSSTTGKSSGAATTTALVVESNTGSTSYTDNFNPFDSSGYALTENVASLVYEPLFQINTLNSTEAPIPWLATAYAWSNGNKTLTLTLRQGVKWSDGSAFTSADVAFTFKAVTTDQAANTSSVPTPTSITTPDANTVTMTYAAPQAANFIAIADQLIVPQAQWSSITSPDKYVMPGEKAIGTGPYVLDNFSPQDVKYKVNPTYWGGAPKVKEISIPVYSSNDAATLALSDGQIDLAGNDINNVVSTFVNKNTKNNHLFMAQAPYFPAGNTVALMLNNKDAKSPFLADAPVRKAISAALNRQSMATQCEQNYEAPATSAGGLTLPIDQAALDQNTANDLAATPTQSTVQSLMQADGFTMTGGKWTKGGKKVTFSIIDPNSFSDYWCDAQEMATQLNTAGFDVTANGAFTFTTWNQAITTGNFDAALHWGQGGTGFQRLQFLVDYTQSAPEGTTAAGDFDRYQSSTAAAAVSAYEAASTPAAAQTALNSLQEVIANDMPAVPVLYGASWYEYTSANFTGWPTSSNPYINPGPNNQAYEYLILHLSPVS